MSSSESSNFDDFGNRIDKNVENSSETTFESISDRIDLLADNESIYREIKSKLYELETFSNVFFDKIASLPERVFNIVVYGSKSSGKTTFINYISGCGMLNHQSEAQMQSFYEKKHHTTTTISSYTNLYNDMHGRSKIVTFIDTPGGCKDLSFDHCLRRLTNNFVLLVDITEPYGFYHMLFFRKIKGNIILVINKIDLIIDDGINKIFERIRYFTRNTINHVFISSAKFNFMTDDLSMESLANIHSLYTDGKAQNSREASLFEKLVNIDVRCNKVYDICSMYFNRKIYKLRLYRTYEANKHEVGTKVFILNIDKGLVASNKIYCNIPLLEEDVSHIYPQTFNRAPISVLVKTRDPSFSKIHFVFMNCNIRLLHTRKKEHFLVIEGYSEQYLDYLLWTVENTMSISPKVIALFPTYFLSVDKDASERLENKHTSNSKEDQNVHISAQCLKALDLKNIESSSMFFTKNNKIKLQIPGNSKKEIVNILSTSIMGAAGIVGLSIKVGCGNSIYTKYKITNFVLLHKKVAYMYKYIVQVVIKKEYLSAFHSICKHQKINKLKEEYIDLFDVFVYTGTINSINAIGLESKISYATRDTANITMFSFKCTRVGDVETNKLLAFSEKLVKIICPAND